MAKVKMFLSGAALALLVAPAMADVEFNAGADLRIRQEIMDNVPCLPNGGRACGPVAASKYKNHMRFRPRVWGEIKGTTQSEATWRLYTRLTDEMRWYVAPSKPRPYAFPGEVILDNLFLEAKGLFDGFVDFTIGRQDLLMLYGMDHVFFDGTPGDGSRTTYTDMARVAFNFEDDAKLDLLALYNFDDCDIRLGPDRARQRGLSGLGSAEPEMDDWGFGAIWSDKLVDHVPYKLFAIQKNTMAYHRKGVKHPATHRTLFGTKLTPQIDDEWSLQLEAMGQVGWNGNHDTLTGASSYAGVNWKSSRDGWKPFGKLGYHFMSGDKNAADEDGGHHAWDPMWARGATESELFLYGTHYGVGWWSNMHYLKGTYGVDFGKFHKASLSMGPIFAAARDGMGGDNGGFKGFQTQMRYDFPLYLTTEGRGLNVFGHVLAEYFNPGDYYKTDKPGWFVRWEVTFRF